MPSDDPESKSRLHGRMGIKEYSEDQAAEHTLRPPGLFEEEKNGQPEIRWSGLRGQMGSVQYGTERRSSLRGTLAGPSSLTATIPEELGTVPEEPKTEWAEPDCYASPESPEYPGHPEYPEYPGSPESQECPEIESENRAGRKWIIASIITAAVLLSVLGFFVIRKIVTKNRVDAAVQRYLDQEYITGEDVPMYIQYRNTVIRAIRHQVLRVDRSTRTARIRISYPDITQMLSAQVSSAEEYYRYCINQIQTRPDAVITKEIDVSYTGNFPNIEIQDNYDLANAMSGNTIELFQQYMQGK